MKNPVTFPPLNTDQSWCSNHIIYMCTPRLFLYHPLFYSAFLFIVVPT